MNGISDQRLKEFQQLCYDELGVELKPDVARELAERFLAAFRTAYRPIPQNDYEKEETPRKESK